MTEEQPSEFPQGSILAEVKKALNIAPTVSVFDVDLILHINSVFAELNQLGVGPSETFVIEDGTASWSDFTTNADLNMVKSYMYLEVRLMFDPPTASVLSALERKRDEYEWRLNVAGDSPLDRTDQNGNEG